MRKKILPLQHSTGAQRVCETSIPGDFQSTSGQGPGQLDQTLELALLSKRLEKMNYRGPSQPKLVLSLSSTLHVLCAHQKAFLRVLCAYQHVFFLGSSAPRSPSLIFCPWVSGCCFSPAYPPSSFSGSHSQWLAPSLFQTALEWC